MQAPQRTPARPAATFRQRAERMLDRISDALDFGARKPHFNALLDDALDAWGARPVGHRPVYQSNIGDDHSPFEFSVALGAGPPEVRLLWEAQGASADARGNLEAARALTERLARRWPLSLARLNAVADLYLDGPVQGFGLWHAVCCWRDRVPAFKVYLDPNARGAANAESIVRETLTRLGFRDAWEPLIAASRRRGADVDSLAYISLDLDDTPRARLKVYYRHYHATADDIERVVSAQRDHRPGDARWFCRAMTHHEGPYIAKPVQTCASLVGEQPDRPSKWTVYFPVAAYAPDDESVRLRTCAWMNANGIPGDVYERVLLAAAHRPLTECAGVQSYVSLRRESSGIRSTVYLSPELYRGHESGVRAIRVER